MRFNARVTSRYSLSGEGKKKHRKENWGAGVMSGRWRSRRSQPSSYLKISTIGQLFVH